MLNYLPLNFALMSRWQNWVTVVLIVWLGGLGLYLVTHPANFSPTDED